MITMMKPEAIQLLHMLHCSGIGDCPQHFQFKIKSFSSTRLRGLTGNAIARPYARGKLGENHCTVSGNIVLGAVPEHVKEVFC